MQTLGCIPPSARGKTHTSCITVMDSFNSLIWDLGKLLDRHPEIHYIRPKNYTEMDLREICFCLQEILSKEVVVAEDIATWVDKYKFHQLGAGRSYDV
jgi:hypothetical protein